ncbi:MAG: hypothetical protein ACLUOI_24405 [Eisenbergiella sp.]
MQYQVRCAHHHFCGFFESFPCPENNADLDSALIRAEWYADWISGIFSILPALLFGPGYGAAVSGLSDFLGFLIKPTGGYLPLLTISAAAGGFLRGFLWEILKKKEDKRMRLLIAAGSGVLLVLGLGSALMTGEGMTPTAAGAAGGALLGIFLLAVDFILSKKILSAEKKGSFPASYCYDCLLRGYQLIPLS